ncbi:tRNA (guanine(10)-N2)-methyltransferase, partial [Symbiodinium microadriaticum]
MLEAALRAGLRNCADAVVLVLLQLSQRLWQLNNEDYEDEAVAEAARRCVLLKAAYRPLAFAETLEGLALQGIDTLRGWPPEKRKQAGQVSWQVRADPGLYLKDHGTEQLVFLMRIFSEKAGGLEALGPVSLEHPDMPLAIVEDPPPVPVRYWLVEEVGQKPQGWLKDFVLNKRPYVSTSTLKPDLAFLMAHLARAREGASVIDPVCGSGSLLLAAAALGARTVGVDANEAALSGQRSARPRTDGEAPVIADNFLALGLPPPELCCAKAAM